MGELKTPPQFYKNYLLTIKKIKLWLAKQF